MSQMLCHSQGTVRSSASNRTRWTSSASMESHGHRGKEPRKGRWNVTFLEQTGAILMILPHDTSFCIFGQPTGWAPTK